eukprot:SAG31_NODE_3789_length_3879_cov_3.452910_1_plen_581_part_00
MRHCSFVALDHVQQGCTAADTHSPLFSLTTWRDRANAVEALINYQIASGDHAYDVAIATSWPSSDFEINSAAPFKCDPNALGKGNAMNKGDPGWPYYDDILWWALAFLRAADMYTYRDEAEMAANMTARSEAIFNHVAARAWNSSEAACGGGIWWSTDQSYKNAIANELFFATAAKLGKNNWATKSWLWFKQSGMINGDSLINDGLGKDCKNNGATEYTYNQGVILGGLSYLHKLTGDAELLVQATKIINAALRHLTDDNGVLNGAGGQPEKCGDGSEFKGIFVRYMRYFIDMNKEHLNAQTLQRWRDHLTKNADFLWRSQDVEGKFPIYWGGTPAVFPSGSVGLQTAAIEAFVAAAFIPHADATSTISATTVRQSQTNSNCSNAGTFVRDRCVCRPRFIGTNCQQEIGWTTYYGSSRQVVIMTWTGRFVSSNGGDRPNHAVSHLSREEYFTVHKCGAGIGLVDNTGKWLALDTRKEPLVAEVVLADSVEVNCSDPHSPAVFIVNVNVTTTNDIFDELVSFRSAVSGVQPRTSFYLAVDSIDSHAEAPIAVAATTKQAQHGHDYAALWFRVRLQQSCADV